MKSWSVVAAAAWFSLASLAQCASADDETSGSYPVYGNWCGPNHPVDTSAASPPIDILDATCMRHDMCYELKGSLDCDCDADLVSEIRANLDKKAYAKPQLKYARNMHNYFQASPCRGDSKKKLLPSRLLHRAYDKAKNTVEKVGSAFASDTPPAKSTDPQTPPVESMPAGPPNSQ